MTSIAPPYQASRATLARAAVAAAVGAGAVLVAFVLPAEYGIDPTGIGRAIGLTALAGETAETDTDAPPAGPLPAAATPVAPQTQAMIARTTPWRRDERTVTIAPHEGVEIKAEMKAGDSLVFRWTASGPVKMDMHGETSMTATSFSTYWKQKGLREAQGDFTAPFAGIHGWYWRNQGEAPVTLTVSTTGFYARLFQPAPE